MSLNVIGTGEGLGDAVIELAKKYKMDPNEVMPIYGLELIFSNSEKLEEFNVPRILRDAAPYLNLFCLSGDGSYSHLYVTKDGEGETVFMKRPYCRYMVLTPDVPKDISKPFDELKTGILMCYREDVEPKWGFIEQGVEIKEFCDSPFNRNCPVTGLDLQIRSCSKMDAIQRLKDITEENYPNYKRYRKEVFKKVGRAFAKEKEMQKEMQENVRRALSQILKTEEKRRTEYIR